VWWRFGPWEQREELLADELRRIDADVVCLQEVWADIGARANPVAPRVEIDGPGDTEVATSQAARLAATCRYDDHRLSWRYAHEGVAFGNAILSRWPIVDAVALPLPTVPGFEENRTALLVHVDTPDGLLPVATTHLNFRWDQSDIRCLQVDAVCRFLAEHADRRDLPVVLTGDMNAESSSDEMRKLTGRAPVPVRDLGFMDAWEIGGAGDGHTWTRANTHAAQISIEADRRIDYVFVGYPDLTSRRGVVTRADRFGTSTTAGMHPTDHFGVLADLQT
jgi:endonuclease/exonuclease/phosphatase family metal-dependent hydrolase